MGRGITFFAKLILVIAALALSATSFAHRFSAEPSSPELVNYLNMGGTLDEICGDIDPAHHLNSACDACLVANSAFLPAAHAATPVSLSCNKRTYLPDTQHQWTATHADHKYRPRAPPTPVIF
ncbi:MAG: hypothetical protein R8G34_20360 [Paracoccaceae bacterium]|nr:hypothetical protein [Paracoccaceae bacterium]